jgi:Coenzyme PQQ synthesis protein D (PqqD)
VNSVDSDHSPRRSTSIESNDLTDGLVLYDTSKEIAHHLNPIATLVWELCDGRPVSEIVVSIARILEVPQSEAQSLYETSYDQLSAAGLLT